LTRFADLHLHTYHSDGTRSPREVVDLARERGLDIIAISDHDNIAAYFEIKPYADERGVTLIPATELSCSYHGVDVHILAYAFDPFNETIEPRLRHFREVRQRRGAEMVERLNALGYDISAERVEQLAAGGAMGRPHVARALVERGYVASVNEAFDRFLGPGKPGYVEKARFQVDEAVALIHTAGGVLSIAHPSHYPNKEQTVIDLLDAGIDAVEVFHPDVPDDDRERFTNIAKFRGRFVTGGSDDHGAAKAVETIGTIRVPEALIEPIMKRMSDEG
jgi:predicted metal-dependent phosphoesterase TrpH